MATMYLPKRFENVDLERSLEIMRAYPLATLISMDADRQPFVSHLPIVTERRGEDVILIGHLARANRHWQLLDDAEVTAIFHGPNAYVTPTWYTSNDVPTWNYAVVHAQGRASLIEDHAGIVSCLETLTATVEQGDDAWKFWIPEDLSGGLHRSIVGVRIAVSAVHAKFKLSQNRSEEDREQVIRGLDARTDDGSRGVAAMMRRLAGT